MVIDSVRIKNYKSFHDTGLVRLSPGFNVIFGKNDSGKSAFIEALSGSAGDKPHRSLVTAPTVRSQTNPVSSVDMILALDSEDTSTHINQMSTISLPSASDGQAEMAAFCEFYRAGGKLGVSLMLNRTLTCDIGDLVRPKGQSLFAWPNEAHPHGFKVPKQPQNTGGNVAFVDLADRVRGQIYAFRAERLNVGISTATGNASLRPDASNLPEVLNLLISSNPHKYEELMVHVRAIFPHITHITAPVEGTTANIRVWSHSVSSARKDLAIPLVDSGTGIGQVLAMLYVVVTAELSQVILIDEPQSFLHPGAVRKLFEIFRDYPRHQYVISTHSPAGLESGDAVLIVRRDGAESRIERVEAQSRQTIDTFLAEVGVRLSDVFGADSVIWVEGKTEEACFPVVIREVAGMKLAGVQILSLVSTGDLSTKDARRILDIYRNLSRGPSLMPQALAFVLDDEGRPESEKRDMERASSGSMVWLPRRLYENFLIDSESIATVIQADCLNSEPIVAAQVDEWLALHASDAKYFPKEVPAAYPGAEWERRVHGGFLLRDLFQDLSGARLEYGKVKHGVELTKLVAERRTSAMLELATLLRTVLSRPPNGGST